MKDLYCPNCHRQLSETDILLETCHLCKNKFEVWHGVNTIIVEKLGTFKKIYEESEEEE